LNELRRNALEQVYNFAVDNIKRKNHLEINNEINTIVLAEKKPF